MTPLIRTRHELTLRLVTQALAIEASIVYRLMLAQSINSRRNDPFGGMPSRSLPFHNLVWKATLQDYMLDAVSLFVLTAALGLLISWVLHRSSYSHASAGDADEDFFQRIQERLNQHAPGGSEGAFTWTQTNEEVELVMPLEPHLKARDVEFRILPATVRLGIRGAAQPLLEVRLGSVPTFSPPRSPSHLEISGWQGKLHRKVQSDECNWSIGASASLPACHRILARRLSLRMCCVCLCCAEDGERGNRSLKLTLVKQTPTKGSLHWTRVLEAVVAG